MPMFLAEVAPAISSTDLAPIQTAIESQISVPTIVGVIAGGVTASAGIVFMYWGARKLARMIMSAFRRGKLSV